MLCDHIEKNHRNTTVIKFEPWLIVDRDSLVCSLFSELAIKVAEIKEKGILEKTISLSAKIAKYGVQLSRGAAPLAKMAAMCGVPYAEILHNGLDTLGGINTEQKSKSLSRLKEELTKELDNINHHFVVVIDDIDRLEPLEAVEITRLIRAVGDFPNVVYIFRKRCLV